MFSAARLRGYRALQDAGLSDAVELQILNTVIAGRLWLPFSLIEIAFRNAADRSITAAHPSGEDWLIAAGRKGDVLVAADVTAPAAFRSARDDGTPDDPVAEAARMAGRQLSRDEISRDDLVAHLMLGFWVHRCPTSLKRDPDLDVWTLIASEQRAPLDDAPEFQRIMTKLLRMRNRVAHHEPLIFRAKHTFRRSGETKVGAELVDSLLSAIPPFLDEVQLAVTTATSLAPMASKALVSVHDLIRSDIGPLEATLTTERRRLREVRDARLTAREADLATRRSDSG